MNDKFGFGINFDKVNRTGRLQEVIFRGRRRRFLRNLVLIGTLDLKPVVFQLIKQEFQRKDKLLVSSLTTLHFFLSDSKGEMC